MNIRDRIVGLKRVMGRELIANPKNWRTHPPRQRDALRGVLEEVGFAGAVIARQVEDGRYQLIDGHLRAETALDQEIPVLVVDLSEDEADKILATHDPLGALAGIDQGKVDELFAGIETGNEALAALLGDMLHPADEKLASEPDGETLGRLSIGGYAPRHVVSQGEHWAIAGKHALVVGSVVNEWPTWTPVLREMGDEAMFAPYAGPLALVSSAARVRRVCIVQPVEYVAGVILDWAEDAFGPDALVQIKGGRA
jgi:ParB-like chromosome segregation protein Spo0J